MHTSTCSIHAYAALQLHEDAEPRLPGVMPPHKFPYTLQPTDDQDVDAGQAGDAVHHAHT